MLFQPEYMKRGYGSNVRLVLQKDSSLVWMMVQGVVLNDEHDAPWGVFIYMYDSSTERELGAEMEYLSNKLRNVVPSMQIALNKGKFMPPEITHAERQIAAMANKGLCSRDIANVRGMGVKSVEKVRRALRKKLGVDRRVNLRFLLQDYGDL
jgi:DNA-binding CsgD family transcriptional regulator